MCGGRSGCDPIFMKMILLNEFLWYCERGEDSPRARVREFNREQPAGIPDPYMFLWAFDSLPPKAQRPVKN